MLLLSSGLQITSKIRTYQKIQKYDETCSIFLLQSVRLIKIKQAEHFKITKNGKKNGLHPPFQNQLSDQISDKN